MCKHTTRFTIQVMRNHEFFEQRTGQYLFNCLPEGPRNAVRGKPFDPFRKEFEQGAVYRWITAHIVFDTGGDIIAIVDQEDKVIWEATRDIPPETIKIEGSRY